MQEIKQFAAQKLWTMLDEEFRDFSMLSEASFGEDEFDANEQRQLSKLLRMVTRWGYSRVFTRLSHSQDGQGIIDTAAGYGEFVRSENCKSYLGVFIAAEAVQYPFAIDSYSDPMIRSDCFRKLGDDGKKDALRLMHLARFVREIDLPEELEIIGDSSR